MKIKENWQSKSKFLKVLFIMQMIISAVVVILCFLGLTNVLDIMVTNNIVMSLVGITIAFSGLENYKKNKVLAYFCFAVTGFIFVSMVIVYSMYLFL